MTQKEVLIQLIDDLPDNSLQTAIAFLQFLKFSEEKEEEYFSTLADEAEEQGEFASLDKAVKEMGFDLNELRNQN